MRMVRRWGRRKRDAENNSRRTFNAAAHELQIQRQQCWHPPCAALGAPLDPPTTQEYWTVLIALQWQDQESICVHGRGSEPNSMMTKFDNLSAQNWLVPTRTLKLLELVILRENTVPVWEYHGKSLRNSTSSLSK